MITHDTALRVKEWTDHFGYEVEFNTIKSFVSRIFGITERVVMILPFFVVAASFFITNRAWRVPLAFATAHLGVYVVSWVIEIWPKKTDEELPVYVLFPFGAAVFSAPAIFFGTCVSTIFAAIILII